MGKSLALWEEWGLEGTVWPCGKEWVLEGTVWPCGKNGAWREQSGLVGKSGSWREQSGLVGKSLALWEEWGLEGTVWPCGKSGARREEWVLEDDALVWDCDHNQAPLPLQAYSDKSREDPGRRVLRPLTSVWL